MNCLMMRGSKVEVQLALLKDGQEDFGLTKAAWEFAVTTKAAYIPAADNVYSDTVFISD